MIRVVWCAFALVGAASVALAEPWPENLLPPDRSIPAAVDHYLGRRLAEEKVAPAPAAEPGVLLRRTTLDLAGRVPTLSELDAYLAGDDPDKRERMVDRLLDSGSFQRHEVYELDTLLMQGTDRSLRGYLEKAVAENRAWDRVFRDLLLPDPAQEGLAGAEEFLKSRINDVDRTTTDVSVLFFGVNVSCAQCHDHPYVGDWSQHFYYGMKSFLARTFDNGGFLAERDHGRITFKSNYGDSHEAMVRFISGRTVELGPEPERTNEDKEREKAYFEKFKKEKQQPPLPENSLRRQLVEIALSDGEKHRLARAIVNRYWARLFGRGLVDPLDQIHAENLPSHPDLLAWLARDFLSHGCDTRRLLRGLVLSEAYARDSLWEGERPAAELFAVGSIRPLTPHQYATSLKLAATTPTRFTQELEPTEWRQRMESVENSARGMIDQFEVPSDNFQVSVSEALLLSNNERMQRDLLHGGDKLAADLVKIEEDREAVRHAARAVLAREPSSEELHEMTEYLARRRDRREEACRQLVWALLTSTEFRFNY